jgi:branched-chain amino acid transport system ATP-binding protein
MPGGEILLRTEGLSKRFGGLTALKGVAVAVRRGEIVGLIGPNGSGKSTLFNCICGFHRPDAGRVWLAGEECTGLAPHRIARRGLSRTFQLAKLFANLPVIENVMLARHLTRSAGFLGALCGSRRYRAEEKAAAAEALDILELVGLAGERAKAARDLPYGSQRLLTLAIALSSRPEILLLDEPTAGMNQQEARTLADILRRINAAGTTVFLVEHNMRFIMGLSERIVVLNHGEVICEGAPDAVRREECVIDAYLGRGFA